MATTIAMMQVDETIYRTLQSIGVTPKAFGKEGMLALRMVETILRTNDSVPQGLEVAEGELTITASEMARMLGVRESDLVIHRLFTRYVLARLEQMAGMRSDGRTAARTFRGYSRIREEARERGRSSFDDPSLVQIRHKFLKLMTPNLVTEDASPSDGS